jgi:hypothetical protein
MKIFIIGSLRKFEETKQKLQPWSDKLKSYGHEVTNPFDTLTGEKEWRESRGQCIKLLLECNTVFILNDWKDSSFGRLLFYIAANLNFYIFAEREIYLLYQFGTDPGNQPPIRKTNANVLLPLLNAKIKSCRDSIYISEALNDTKRTTNATEELYNYELLHDILCQKYDR